jgi:hypothetical protein
LLTNSIIDRVSTANSQFFENSLKLSIFKKYLDKIINRYLNTLEKMEINVLAIIFSFVINFLKRYSSKVCSFLIDKLYNFTETTEINSLNVEIKALIREKDQFNPIDEFAKYALADRKLNKALDKLQVHKTNIRSVKMKKMFYFNMVYTFIIGVISVALIWKNYDKPIIDFSSIITKDSSAQPLVDNLILNNTNTEKIFNGPIIFYPLNNLLSFPSTHKKNSIGVTAWLFLVNRSIEIFLNKFVNNRAKID